MYLNEQHRMWTLSLTKWISAKYYGGMMLDGTSGKPTPLEVAFITKVFNDLFKINSNFGIVLVQDSYSKLRTAALPCLIAPPNKLPCSSTTTLRTRRP
jgi:hypothetical protein